MNLGQQVFPVTEDLFIPLIEPTKNSGEIDSLRSLRDDMRTNYFQRLKNSGSLHYPLMASVAMHLCVFATVLFWNPEMPAIPIKNPPVSIKVALLETPQKTPAPAAAKKTMQTHSRKPQEIDKPMAFDRPAVPQSVPVPAKYVDPRRTQNFALEPLLNNKSFSEISPRSSSKLKLSDFSSKLVSTVSPLAMSANNPIATRPISSQISTMATFRSFQNSGLHPVNLQPLQMSFKVANSSSKIYGVAETAMSNLKILKPAPIQASLFPTVGGTAPVSSQRVAIQTTYLPSNTKPFKMASLFGLTPNFSRKSIQKGEGNDDKLKRGYTRQIRHRIAQKKFYPALARRRGFEGQPVVAFVLNKDGSLGHLALDKTSGHKILDQAALKAVKKGAPFPEIPEQLNLNFFKFKLPVSFTLE